MAVLVPIAVVFVASLYSDTTKSSENRVKYVELAASILREEPKKEVAALRSWAVDVLAANSPVPLSPAARNELQGFRVFTVTCPAGTTLTNGVCLPNMTHCPAGNVLIDGYCKPSASLLRK